MSDMALVPEKLNNNPQIFHGRMWIYAKKKKVEEVKAKHSIIRTIFIISFYIKF